MANKQIEKTLADYFGELLNEPNQSSDLETASAPPVEKVVDQEASLSVTSGDGIAENSVNVANESPSPQAKLDTVKSAQTESIETKSTEAKPTKNNPVDCQLREIEQKENLESKTSRNDAITKNKNTNELNHLSDELKAKSTVPPEVIQQPSALLSQLPSAQPSTPTPGTTAYEQHKQRLERMLQQVSALDSSTTATAPTVAPSSTESITSTEIDINQQQEVDIATDAAAFEMPPLSSEWLENGRPNWAQERFDILLIEVNGLQLAVPLVALGQIQDLDEESMTSLFGQSDWFMGLQKTPMGNVKTVNTAKFVMPERYKDDHDYKYVVSINGLSWGLAVDSIHQPISIDPDSIRWRPKRESRPWMAGMVKDHMCVLLDIPAMGEILQEQDKNHGQTTGA